MTLGSGFLALLALLLLDLHPLLPVDAAGTLDPSASPSSRSPTLVTLLVTVTMTVTPLTP